MSEIIEVVSKIKIKREENYKPTNARSN